MQAKEIKYNKKKNKKPIYILLAFVGVFCMFIYGLTRPSLQSQAIKELETSYNKKDIEMVWHKFKAELYQDEEFLLEIRTKLTGFNLNEDEKQECMGWLPPAPKSLNVIIIPDLSRRILDTVNNPDQIQNDIFVLNAAWKTFVKTTRLKEDSNDRLMIDVTDREQASGQFNRVADQLQYDLSTHKGKSNILYFTPDKDQTFNSAITEMYQLAKTKPLGADYRYYFRQYLDSRLQKSTFFDTYINKVIIITDGYLEAEGKKADTRLIGYEKQLYNAVDAGNVQQVIAANGLNIPKVNIDLSNTSIMVCEVSERNVVPFTKIPWAGKKRDFEILKNYWEDWFTRMGAKKTVFIPREQANEITAVAISNFIND